jgi:phage-related holin
MPQLNSGGLFIKGVVVVQRYFKALFSLDTLVKPTNAVAATFGAFFSPWLDHLSNSGKFWAFILLFSIIIGDWIAGTAASRVADSYRSEYGNAAIFRTLLLLWIPFIGMFLDKVSMTVFHVYQPGIAYYALTFGLAYHNWVSMTANCSRAGWSRWIPKKVLNYVTSEIKAKAERAYSMRRGV